MNANHSEGEKNMNMEKNRDKNASSKSIIYVIKKNSQNSNIFIFMVDFHSCFVFETHFH